MHYPATVRVGPLANIPFVLRFLGYDPEPILTKVSFKIVQFENPDNRIPYLAAGNLLAHCVAVTGCQNFGLLLGTYANPSHLGIAGFLLQSAANVNSALKSLINYLNLHDEGGFPALTITDNTVLLSYTIHQADVEATGQIYDLSIVIACKIMRSLCGERWNPAEVLLTRNAPGDPLVYKKYFQAPVRYNSAESALVFSKKWLGYTISTADALLQNHLIREAEALHARQAENLLKPLQQLLVHSLANKQMTTTEIAKQLGMHERTFHRQLKSRGTSFRHELEHCRYAISQQLLTATNESLVNISLALGYSNVSAFTRAFKKWSGETPTKWRKEWRKF